MLTENKIGMLVKLIICANVYFMRLLLVFSRDLKTFNIFLIIIQQMYL